MAYRSLSHEIQGIIQIGEMYSHELFQTIEKVIYTLFHCMITKDSRVVRS